MFKITNTEIARAVQSGKGYTYDFGGRRFFLMRVCQADGCGFDFCAGLSRTCLDLVRQKLVGVMVTEDEYEGLKLIDTRFAAAGTVLLLEEYGNVVFNDVLAEDCLIVKLEGPVTTRRKLVPDRLYVLGVTEEGTNGLVVQAVSANHARDMFGRLHDLRCSLTAQLLVEGALNRKIGPVVGRVERPSQQPNFDPARGTMLVLKGDIADPVPHEARGLSEAEQQQVVEKGLSGAASPPPPEGEREYTEGEIRGFEDELRAGAALADRFGAAIAESAPGEPISAVTFQEALSAADHFESAKSVFGIPASPTPARAVNADDLAYAAALVNHMDSQVEGMRRKIAFTSSAVDGAIRAGLANPSAAYGGTRVSLGDVPAAVGKGARDVAIRVNDILGLARQNRLDADAMVRAHRLWFRLEAYKQRMLDLDSVFRMNRSPLALLSQDALDDIGAKIGAATSELYLILRVLGADTQFGRTTLEGTEQGRLYQALNSHPDMLRLASDAMAGMFGFETIDIPVPSGSEDSNPQAVISIGFGVPVSQLEELEQVFASSLGPDGFDPAIGEIPAEAQEAMEASVSALFGAPPITGAMPESFIDVAERAAMYEGGRIEPPEEF